MGLSSLHLDAFFAAAQSLNFSQAAKDLFITQSALSQRIKALEEELDLTLFVRMPRGVQLTEAGQTLLQYSQARSSLEEELMLRLRGKDGEGLGGALRIAGYSSVVRSVVIPALCTLLRDNPSVQPHLQNGEMRHLPEMLNTGQVDFVVMDTEIHRGDIETETIGIEEYVMVDSVANPVKGHLYIDHDPDDTVTDRFLRSQGGKVPNYRRAFMDEIYALIDGVAAGLGRGIVSKHLVANDPRVQIVSGFKSMEVPVFLHYHKQPYFTALHKSTVNALQTNCPSLLTVKKTRKKSA